MSLNCKGLCESHPNIFMKNRKSKKIGESVYYCKLCAKYVKITQIIKNTLFKLKNKCICCKARFRIGKLSRQKQKQKKCIKCNNFNTLFTKDNRYGGVYPNWHRFGTEYFLCHNCYMKKQYRLMKLKKLFTELKYSFVIMKMI